MWNPADYNDTVSLCSSKEKGKKLFSQIFGRDEIKLAKEFSNLGLHTWSMTPPLQPAKIRV